MHSALRRFALVVSSLAAAAAGAGALPAQAALNCDRYASPTGDDGATGAVEAPLRTTAHLVGSLAPGQTGCLLPGTYAEDVTIRSGGSPGSPITLTSAPQGRAVLSGRLWVTDTANDVVIRDLDLDGRNALNLPSPSVNGDRVAFIGNDVSNSHTTICFDVGSVIGYGVAHDVLLEANRIHNCGILPPQNHHHGVFLEASRNGVIRGNLIYDNADKGILVFPDSDGNLIEQNVIDGNSTGILVGGSQLGDAWHPLYPQDNLVRHNVITNSRRYNVEGYWEWRPPTDANNVVRDNCLSGAGFGIQVQPPEQVSVWGAGFLDVANRLADPAYENRGVKNFRLAPGSGCAGYGPILSSSTGSGSGPAAGGESPGRPTPTGSGGNGGFASGGAPFPAPAAPRVAPPGSTSDPRGRRATRAARPLKIAFTARPRVVGPSRLAVRIAAAPRSRIVFVVRSPRRIVAVVRLRSGSSRALRHVLRVSPVLAAPLRVTASVRSGGQLRRKTFQLRLTKRELKLVAARRRS